jgi:hypothetical protein
MTLPREINPLFSTRLTKIARSVTVLIGTKPSKSASYEGMPSIFLPTELSHDGMIGTVLLRTVLAGDELLN